MNDVTATGAVVTGRGSPAGVASASSSSAAERAARSGKELPPVVSVPATRVPVQSSTSVVTQGVDIQETLKAAVAQMNEYIQSTQRDLHFSYDAASGDTVVKVLDRNTQKVIRQIPDEIFLKLARNLNTNEPVHLFSAQA